jgi:hypothetical protein
MVAAAPATLWLDRLGHDLVKRVLWPARDRRDLGGPAVAGELAPRLIDEAGAPITALALWQALRAEAPDDVPAAALDDFAAALARATAAATADDVAGVLALEAAHATLARIVKGVR